MTTDYTTETDLTARQSDFAVFLPALSTFHALFVGRQRRGLEPLDENKKGSGEPISHQSNSILHMV